MLVIPAGNPSEWTGPTGNNTYLIEGAVPTLIDAGVGDPAHLAALEHALEGSALAQILITHAHPDHVQGVPALLDRWPSAVVRNHPPDACRDREAFAAGDTRLLAIHTPGHSPDHFCFLDEATRDVYCGDLARLGGTVVIPASAGGNLVEYLESLRLIRDLDPRRLLPGHGPIVGDARALLDEYLAHREQRERQIVNALRSGATTAEAIVARIYGTLPSVLVRAAVESVHAHLFKLQAESRVVHDEDRWHLTRDE